MQYSKYILPCVLSLSTSLPASALAVTNVPGNKETVKNVILMIPDGMSVTNTTLARLYKGSPLALDALATGLISTWSGDGTIADSAPAGTALATGWKAQSGNIGSTGEKYDLPNVRTPEAYDRLRPVATILEASHLKGKGTGIISTSEFMHATPADFTSHDPSRKNYNNLTEQIVYNNLDVILGGGIKYLKPENRKDKEDMAAVLKSRGYAIVNTPEQMDAFSGKKLVGVFGKTDAHTALSYDMDRNPEREPSLSQMTQKAIDVLSQNPNGFFLMVEGSKVDWAAHANDPLGVVSDVLAFDEAVNTAVNFARKEGNTLVIAVSDHGNSGVSIGDRDLSKTYDKTHWTAFINPLKKAKMTGEGFEELLMAKLAKQDPVQIRALAKESLGLENLTDDDVKNISNAKKGEMNYVTGPVVGQRAHIGYTTNGHTGEDIVLYSYDPRGRLLGGLMENTQIADFMASSLNVDLEQATDLLFTDAMNAFKEKGATVKEDFGDAGNPVLVVTKNDQVLRIPQNKSIAWLNEKEIPSDGVTVYNGSRWFVSKSLVAQIQ